MARQPVTIENVHNAISLLESFDPRTEYSYESAFSAYLTIKQLPVFIQENIRPTEVFRTRTCWENVFFKEIREISLPSHDLIKHFARCNRPFQSKFYCSENSTTSYEELVEYWKENREPGEHVYATIGRWITHKPFSALLITTPDRERRESDYDIKHGDFFDEAMHRQTGEELDAYFVLFRYLFDKFRKPAKKDLHTYLVTSSYCNAALFKGVENIDAIYYPSVPYKGRGVNFAFNNKFIYHENIELLEVYREKFEVYIDVDGNKALKLVETIPAKSIDYKNGLINW